jgi:anti-sigma regulatory factor (Ser/Thr protein kinase)
MGRPTEAGHLRLRTRSVVNSSATPQIERFRHEALLYSGWAEFVAGTVPFIRDGVRAGEPVLVVESPEKIQTLQIALGKDAGAVFFADMANVGANPARIIPAWHEFVSRHGGAGQRLRGIGEPIWKERSPDELIECQRHESLLNTAFGNGQPWWLLCPYDTEKLNAAVIEEARRSHEFVSEGGTWERSGIFRGLESSGAPFAVPLPEPRTGIVRLAFTSEDLVAVRGLVSRVARTAGLAPSRAAELVAAVNEVATNSIVHGGGGGMLRIWQEQSALVCEIGDKGRFNQPLVDRQRPTAELSAPRGLWLANQLCDLVQIRNLTEGTVVRLHKRLSPPDRHVYLVPDAPESGSEPAS